MKAIHTDKARSIKAKFRDAIEAKNVARQARYKQHEADWKLVEALVKDGAIECLSFKPGAIYRHYNGPASKDEA